MNRALLASGADITAMNTVRKHLSAIKGGRLAAAAFPAGDGQPPHLRRARRRSERHRLGADGRRPDHLRRRPRRSRPLRHRPAARGGAPPRRRGATRRPNPAIRASPAPGSRSSPRRWRASRPPPAVARAAGVTPLILGDAIEGEAREVGRALAGIALSAKAHGVPVAPPAVLLSGGETTVTVSGNGRGGRNVEFLAGLALGLHGAPGIHALAADTDGVDGSEDNAGAFLTPDTLARARAAGLDVPALLAGQRLLFALRGPRRPRRHRPDAHQRQRFPGDPGSGRLNSHCEILDHREVLVAEAHVLADRGEQHLAAGSIAVRVVEDLSACSR